MIRIRSALQPIIFGAVLAMSPLAGGPSLAQSPPADFSGMVRQKSPSVVAILTRQMIEQQRQEQGESSLEDLLRRRFGQQERQPRFALGSGFVIRDDGYIVTNNHVVENAEEIHVRLNDGTDIPAKLVGRDPETDIAVLKVEPKSPLPAVAWGDSDRIEPGAWTIAVGSPFGLGGTVTVGVLSARSRDIGSGPYDNYLQTDAAINRGNSGGPLFNAAGEVIGVNTAIYSPSGGSVGIGFAVPSKTAQSIADQLIRTGHVVRGYIGVRLQEITPDLAKALGRSDDKGALVASVEHGGPAEKAGMRPGDVIASINGSAIDSGRDLSRSVAALAPGAEARVGIVREGRTQDLTLRVGARPEAKEARAEPESEGQPSAPGRLGLSVAPVPRGLRDRLGLSDGGLVVRGVDPSGPAAAKGLQQGDVIVSAGGKPVSSTANLAEAWAEAQKDKKPLLLGVRRGEDSVFVAIPGGNG